MRCRALVAIALPFAIVALVSCSEDSGDGGPGGMGATFPPATTPTTDGSPTTGASPTDTPTPTTAPSGSPGSTATTAVTPPGAVDEIAVTLEPVASVDQPVAFAVRAGDPSRYVASQVGRVVAVRDGGATEVVLDVRDDISYGGEQGLLGLAFSLDGSHAYVHTTQPDGDGRVDEYAVDEDGTFDRGSRRELIRVEHGGFPNHNGGHVVVGPDGLLYLGFGDGGGGGDPFRAGQDPTTFLGKILRVDPTPSADGPYTVPADNPFVGVDGVRPEIWSYGLRNPWKFSFDRGTGDLWVADVGQGEWEEVNHVPGVDGAGAGTNFGWSAYEGTHRYNEDQTATDAVLPVHEYPHTDGNVSVTGGYVYRGTAIPGLVGAYVFGDYGSGRIWALRPNDEDAPDIAQIAGTSGLASFGEDADGEIYVLSIATNTVYRLVAA